MDVAGLMGAGSARLIQTNSLTMPQKRLAQMAIASETMLMRIQMMPEKQLNKE